MWETEGSIDHRADLGLEDDGDASHGKAPQAAAGRSSRMPQSRNQSSPGEPPPPPPLSAGAGGRDIAAAAAVEQRGDLSCPLVFPLFSNSWIFLGRSRVAAPDWKTGEAGRGVDDRWAPAWRRWVGGDLLWGFCVAAGGDVGGQEATSMTAHVMAESTDGWHRPSMHSTRSISVVPLVGVRIFFYF